jgi:YidC/Oxa1 family membrane protein insertase
MFTTIIVQPIFNLLVLIYALLPGQKQIHHAKAMRELQPELKKIKAAAKGDRQKESALTMELYKEREINPFASLGILVVQIPILIGLYSGLQKIIKHPQQIIEFSYPSLHHLSWMQQLSGDIHKFDNSLFGVVNLTRTTIGPGGIYWFGLLIAAASAYAQYLQSKQLMPVPQDARSLRSILRDAGKGRSAEQQEVNAAVGRSTIYLVPAMVFVFALNLAIALPLYWLTSSVVAYIQQSKILREDAEEADAKVTTPKLKKTDKKSSKTIASKNKSKRRKR